jgi:hypothetical protein
MGRNNLGYTLIELLMASGIGALVILGSTTMLLQFLQASWYSNHTSEQWSNIQTAQLILPQYFGQALNVDWTNAAIGNIGAGRGQIRFFTSGFNATGGAQAPESVAAFLREAGYPSPSNPGSDIRATAVYFRNPSVSESGQLIVSSSGPGFGPANLSSNDPWNVLDSIVELEVGNAGYLSVPGDPVRALRLRIVFRRFIDPDQTQWQYCPQDQIPSNNACQTSARFVDETVFLDIPVVNNRIPTDFGTEETLYGNLYFFNAAGGAQ